MRGLSLEGVIGIVLALVLATLDQAGLRSNALTLIMLFAATALCVDAVRRSEWANKAANRKSKLQRIIGASVFITLCFGAFGMWVWSRKIKQVPESPAVAQNRPQVAPPPKVEVNVPPPVVNISPPVHPGPSQKPDISACLLQPKDFALALINTSASDIAVRDPEYNIAVWDLDIPDDKPHGVLVSTPNPQRWISRREYVIVYAMSFLPHIGSMLKSGDRVFGWVTVACPDCAKYKAYWVYGVYGQSGWYSQIHGDALPDFNLMRTQIPAIRKDPETYFRQAGVNQEDRVRIEDRCY